MRLLIGHLVDSRNMDLAIDYIRRFVGDKNQHIFALCGRVHLDADEIPFELRNVSNFFIHINTSQFISDWVARIIKIASEMEFDFLQIRDWDDDYGTFELPTCIPKEVQLICPNYEVKYVPSNLTPNTNPYGSFSEDIIHPSIVDPRLEPYVIHRQFKFFGKPLIDRIARVMWTNCTELYPKLRTLDDTLLLPIALIECYLNDYEIMKGINSDMKFVVRDSSDTHKDSLSIRHSKSLDTLGKIIRFLSIYYTQELNKDLWLSKFIYKYAIDRGSKNLFSISYHEMNDKT